MKRVMVLGSFAVDLMGRSSRFPEHGETVKSSVFQMGPGGKGFNQAIAAKRAGAEVEVAIKVGTDAFATIALDYMAKEGMNTALVRRSEKEATGAALIMVEDETSQNMISVYLGANNSFTKEDLAYFEPYIRSSDFLLMQLEINLDAVERAAAVAKEQGVKVILNPAPAAMVGNELLCGLFAVTPNEVEAKLITGVTIKSRADCERAAEWFFEKGVQNVIITLGKNGVFASDGKSSRLIPVNPGVEAVDSTGAGDAFCGGLLAALGEGKDIFEAAYYGNLVANLSVTKFGTAPAMPYQEEIAIFMEQLQC